MLDDKLVRIVQLYHLTSFVTKEEAIKMLKELSGSASPETLEAITQIKRAFADEGWVHIERYSGGGIAVNGEVLRTGQEWYIRFEEELKTKRGKGYPYGQDMSAIEAAKKASGGHL